METRKVLFERKYKAGYVYRREIWNHAGHDTEMVACYTPKGDYIGGARDARRKCIKYGLSRLQKSTPDSCVCSIGFQSRTAKWFGWSHRAIYGFGVGDWAFYDNPKRKKTKRIKTLAEAKRSAARFAESVS